MKNLCILWVRELLIPRPMALQSAHFRKCSGWIVVIYIVENIFMDHLNVLMKTICIYLAHSRLRRCADPRLDHRIFSAGVQFYFAVERERPLYRVLVLVRRIVDLRVDFALSEWT